MLKTFIPAIPACLLFALCFLSTPPGQAQSQRLHVGPWHAALHRPDGKDIVFNFDVKDSAGRQYLFVRNAGERIMVDGLDVHGDSVAIHLPFFESEFRALLTPAGDLSGFWFKHLTDHYQIMPFTASWEDPARFPAGKSPIADVSGRWAAYFGDPDKGKPELLVGEFVQKGIHLTGTFLEQTGDYRYLEGVVDGDSMRLSCFDGGHAYLFTARINDANNITGGRYFAGPAFVQPWTAVRSADAKLADEFSLTSWDKAHAHIHFTFRDLRGKPVSFSDPRFRNKVVLIQLMGSWCPNCMDETRFLSKFYDQYRSKGVEIVALAYERSTDFARSQVSVRSFQKRFEVNYPMLITGVSVNDSLRSQKTLPQLDAIVGFPTTLFINKRGDIEKIHTGFNGPGTGEHYEEQKKEFQEVVDEMLKE